MKLVRPVPQQLRFIKQNQAYVKLYKSVKKNTYTYCISVFVCTHGFMHLATRSNVKTSYRLPVVFTFLFLYIINK